MKVVKLCHGPGNGIDTACLVTASNMLIGKGHMGDSPTCQCPLIAGIAIVTNDGMPDNVRHKLLTPLIWEIINTRNSEAIPKRLNHIHNLLLSYNSELFRSEDLESVGRRAAQALISKSVPWQVLVTLMLDLSMIGDKRPRETLTKDELCTMMK
jgi:hypothetical protein